VAVTIIGIGRSGSSLTSRLLNISGLYLGPAEEMMAASDANETGFWEHLGIYNINLRILELFGGNWEVPPILPAGWTTSDAIQPLRHDAMALVESMNGQAPWGWKEPRTTITLPFWKSLIPDLRVIVCLRNPLDVYSSLIRIRHRRTWPYYGTFEGTMALWRYYTELALRKTRPDERVIINYEEYFQDYRRVLEPAWAFLGLEPIALGTPEDQALRDFIEPGVKHSQHTLRDVLAHPYIPCEVKQLYERIQLDRAQLESELAAAADFNSDASPSCSSLFTLLQTIETDKEDTRYLEDWPCDPLEAQDLRARALEEQLTQVRCANDEALDQAQRQNADLRDALLQSKWQMDWMTSSKGVRLILKLRSGTNVYRQHGLMPFLKRLVQRAVGQRGSQSRAG
jgi:hypothetical protein